MNVLVGVISDFEAWVLPRRIVDDLRREFPQHTFLDAWDADTIHRLLPECEIAFTPTIDRAEFPSLARLRWVQSPAAGVGSLLFPELVASPVVLTSARGIRARSMAEHVIAVTLALARQLPAAFRFQTQHRWGQDALEGASTAIVPVAGRCMGIVGLGSIGVEIAKLAAPLGLRVRGIRRRTDGAVPDGVEEVLPPERLHDLLAWSDIVVLAAPLTAATRGLVGAAEVAAMKRGAFLINIGRGRLVVDDAVVDGLARGQIGGAALDVFTHEPLAPASPYWDAPNVIVTPHVSGAMADYWTPLVGLFSENLRRFERGEALINQVDKTSGY
jgi:phosphoglycerate dehydrogenase-like enzyme